jgi:hypothetical protein
MIPVLSRTAAIAQGKKKYFTGKPCKHGHVAERHVQNWTCVECHSANMLDVQRNWRAKNPKKVAEYTAKYASAHAETNKAWRANNVDKIREHARGWRLANPSKMAQYGQKWRANNRAHMQYLKAKRRADVLRRTPLWLDAEDWWLIDEIYDLANQRAKATKVDWHVDHIVPLRGGVVSGLHVPHNLQVILASENVQKGNRYAA